MALRESALKDPFDPAAFHSAASMVQSGWAEGEVRKSRRGIQDTLKRFYGTITFVCGTLLVLLLRPVDVMDGRDVTVSALAVAACVAAAFIGTKLAMTMVRTPVEIDRIIMWVTALVLGLAVSAAGVVPALARDADDYITEVPGYTMSTAPAFLGNEPMQQGTGLFADVGTWSLSRDGRVAGAVGVFLIADEDSARQIGGRRFVAAALRDRSLAAQSQRLAGKDVLITRSRGEVQIGWLDGSAVVIVSGKTREQIQPAAAALIRE